MLSRLTVEHYKSLFDIDINLEPLTVFIGPNGSGKLNICEALAIGSATLREIIEGEGIAEALGDLMLDNRQRFDELEKRLSDLVPNISRISLERSKNKDFLLNLVDRYADHRIPASEVSDGTLRILAFLTAIYQIEPPSILMF